MRLIFVRRGYLSTFNVLVERCQLLDDVDVRWDRRIGNDRRLEMHNIPANRRGQERRRLSLRHLDLRGYTVVDLPQTPDSIAHD
jgi:hypothetical protein